MTIIIIILAVLAILVIWGIGLQRKLVSAEELCKNSMSQIGVQQNSRWDALTSLAELVKSYNEHEYKTIMEVIGQRKEITPSSSAAEAQVQEDALSKAFGQIKLVVERYPELKANQQYLKTMDSVNTYENQVRLARMTYNDTVTKFNRMVRQFPDSIIAGLLRFTTKDYLAEPAGKTDMPSMKI
ncbi:MAG: LemA family protein [Candidatus Cryptobacteroides sp.]|jgi:LemA protein|nr:LemA family protein [Rikenellaceae bacterium]